ncbi:unnamed protein product, partial [Discosporangium mesarthrocarpum]
LVENEAGRVGEEEGGGEGGDGGEEGEDGDDDEEDEEEDEERRPRLNSTDYCFDNTPGVRGSFTSCHVHALSHNSEPTLASGGASAPGPRAPPKMAKVHKVNMGLSGLATNISFQLMRWRPSPQHPASLHHHSPSLSGPRGASDSSSTPGQSPGAGLGTASGSMATALGAAGVGGVAGPVLGPSRSLPDPGHARGDGGEAAEGAVWPTFSHLCGRGTDGQAVPKACLGNRLAVNYLRRHCWLWSARSVLEAGG